MAVNENEVIFLEGELTPEGHPFLVQARYVTGISVLYGGAEGHEARIVGASTVTVMGLPRPLGVKGSPEQIRDVLVANGFKVIKIETGAAKVRSLRS